MLLISPTAYKGTLSPWAAANLMRRAALKENPRLKLKLLPLADGGDGTLEVLVKALGGKIITTRVTGPEHRPVRARWAILKNKTAVIEMAEASGLKYVRGKNNVLTATSFGTGHLISEALHRGCKKILIGVGGTATADGGAEALRALGLTYWDKHGNILSGRPIDLPKIARIDRSKLHAQLSKTDITVLCDVTNPLLGAHGSARTFGPQKGATPAQVHLLEKALAHWAKFARKDTRQQPGAGAAGALAFGLSAFAGAKLVAGTPFIAKTIGWNQVAHRAKWIITGEGRFDQTSLHGKVIGYILRNKHKARVVVLTGHTPFAPAQWQKLGIFHLRTLGRRGLKEAPQMLMRQTRGWFQSEDHP